MLGYFVHEGTKVQNAQRLYTGQYAYADKYVSVQEVYGHLAKTKALSSSSLLPTLRGISGTA